MHYSNSDLDKFFGNKYSRSVGHVFDELDSDNIPVSVSVEDTENLYKHEVYHALFDTKSEVKDVKDFQIAIDFVSNSISDYSEKKYILDSVLNIDDSEIEFRYDPKYLGLESVSDNSFYYHLKPHDVGDYKIILSAEILAELFGFKRTKLNF